MMMKYQFHLHLTLYKHINNIIKEVAIMNKADKISEAINFLSSNGFVVKIWTQEMEEDSNECYHMDSKGIQKNCDSCSCNVCLRFD